MPDLAGLGAAGLLRQRVHGTTVMMGLLPVGQGQMTMFWSLPVEALGARRVDRSFRPGAAPQRRLWPEAAASSTTPPLPTTSRARPTGMSPCRAGTTGRCCSSATPPTAPARSSGRAPISALLDAHALFCALAESDDLAAALALFAKRRSSTVRFYRQASHLLTPFFQSRLAPLGWLRDAFMGFGCHLPGLRPLMGSTLAGTRRGWLSSSPLDGEGRYPL